MSSPFTAKMQQTKANAKEKNYSGLIFEKYIFLLIKRKCTRIYQINT